MSTEPARPDAGMTDVGTMSLEAVQAELVRNVLLAVLSSLAKIEAQKISERTKAGLERARRRGARIGRPQLEEGLRSEITQRLADGATPFAVARALGIDRKTVLKCAGHPPCQPQHQPKAELAGIAGAGRSIASHSYGRD